MSSQDDSELCGTSRTWGSKRTARILPFIALSIPSQDDGTQTAKLHTDSKCLFTTSRLCLKAPVSSQHDPARGRKRRGSPGDSKRYQPAWKAPSPKPAPPRHARPHAEAGASASGSVRPARVRLDKAPRPSVQTWEGCCPAPSNRDSGFICGQRWTPLWTERRRGTTSRWPPCPPSGLPAEMQPQRLMHGAWPCV